MSPAASPLTAHQIADLEELIGPHRVRTSFPDRLAYQNDCWPRGIILSRGRRLDHHLPSAIVQPADEAQVREIVNWARRQSVPIVPFGAGSGVCGGAVADEQAIVVDLKGLDDLIELDEEAATVRAGPGIIGMDLERYLNQAGWTMGHFPSSLYCSSLGGYLAGRSAGQCSSRYGKIEDMVLSMRVVTGTGQVLDTAADIGRRAPAPGHEPGRDLNPIFVGSEGTLGVITEALMRIEPMPTTRRYRGFQFSRLDLALGAIREVMQLGLRPAVVRLYDEVDSVIAGSKKKGGAKKSPTRPSLFQKLAGRALDFLPSSIEGSVEDTVERAGKALMGRAIGQPLLLNRVIDAVPGHCMLVIGFEGTNDLVDDEADYAFEIFRRYGVDMGRGPGDHWLENRYSVSYKQSPMFDTGAFVDTMEVSTTWDKVEALYHNVRRALRPHVFVMAHFSHVYPEGSSIYFTFAGFAPDLDSTLEKYETTWKTGLDAVASTGASVAHHHGVGQSKAPWTHHDHPGGPALFKTVKDKYDPDRILNPGKVYP